MHPITENIMDFKEFNLNKDILKALEDIGFEKATAIQEETLSNLLDSKTDLVGLAQTGTGKTAAFGLPMIHNIDHQNKVQGLVLCPTRELCLQINKDIQSFSKYLKLNTTAIYGGADIKNQIKDIKRGVSIIVATPGRLIDLIKRKVVKLQDIKIVVLDEADEMLNMGFKEDIDFILEETNENKSTWLFSATMPKEVARIASNYMQKPHEISIGHKNQSNENIEHHFYAIRERDRYEATKRIIDYNPSIYGLIFCRTRIDTAEVAEKLSREGYKADPLHGDLSQAQRTRVMTRFRNKEIQLVVATDVAARGLDVADLTHVIHHKLPEDIENYTHRSGRTGRAGKKGISVSFLTKKELHRINQIEKVLKTSFIRKDIPEANNIVEKQVHQYIDKVNSQSINDNEIKNILENVLEKFENDSKEDVIKKFLSIQFKNFVEYYKNSNDLNKSFENSPSDRKSKRDRRKGKDRGDRGPRVDDRNSEKFHISLGRNDNMNPGALIRIICDSTKVKSGEIGKIQIGNRESFFATNKKNGGIIISALDGKDYEGQKMNIKMIKSTSGVSTKREPYRGSSRKKSYRGNNRNQRDRSHRGFSKNKRKRK